MDFSNVIGQEPAKERLIQMVKEGRLPHALLFCGPEGVGKMALAMAFASYLLTIPDGEDNGSLDTTNALAMLRKWEHPDLHFSYPTIKRSNMSSDHQPISNDFTQEWHEMIMQGTYFTMNQWMKQMGATTQQAIITGAESDELSRILALKSSQGGYKIAIIWRPERMNLTSANKLLKLLEEPPHKTIFLMVCEEPEKLLETIISRTQRIDVKRIDDDAIEQALITQRGIDNDAAHRIARIANGSWLKALETLDTGNENREFLNMFQMLMRLCYMRNVKDLKRWSEVVSAYGREKERRMLTYFQQQVRENFIFNFQRPELNYMTLEEEGFARNFARFINEANVIEINELFEKANRDIGQNANAKVVFYDIALKLIVLLLKK
ncbi:DNA polymerase III subunit delta [Prevotella histicola]|uniref:DNA polymerase III subunit n=1 Tax=Prevotella histicola TaxID=470565 RepID=UPI0028EC4EAE|nr:DNA polymerase III subunit delta [Prevotella histicola]